MPNFKRVLASMAIASVVALTGCATDPTTGDSFVSLFSWDDEAALGLEAAPGFTEEFGGPVADQAIQAYVTEVGSSMIPHIEDGVPDDLPWEFTLLDSGVINAFALPGGKVFITRGLANELENEAQLAGVLGHEIGHVTARHGNQQMSKSVLLQGGLAVGSFVVGVADEGTVVREYGQYGLPVAQVGGQLVMLSYGRDAEYQADELGMRYMSRAGYKPSGQLGVMQVLAAMAAGGERPPVFLSTHPYPEDRIDRIERLLQTTFAQSENDPGHVLRSDVYQRRMLRPLASLPPARGRGIMLANASLWCGVCRNEAEALTLADRWSRRISAHE